MKFLFAKTLGSPKAFQDFKEELEQLISKGIYPEFSHIKKISDEDVPGLYMEIFLNPEKGLLTRYLRLAKMVYYDTDKKTLITHGFLTKENFLQVPGREKSQSLNDWLHDLNTWGSEGVEAAFAGEKERALDLITYQEPKVIEGHWVGPQDNSVIQGRPWTDLYDISSPTKEILRTLQLEDVSIVASGHSPVGDVPVVVKDGGVEFIMLDTSATKPPRNASVEINEENESDIRSFLSFSKDELQLFEYGSAYSGRSGIRTEEGHWILGNLNGEEISVSFKKNPYGRWGQASYKIG